MSIEPSSVTEKPIAKHSQRIWSLGQISLASLIASPIGAAFLMSRNEKVFGNPRRGNQLIFYGFVFSTIIFAILFCIPEALFERIPKFLIPLAYTSLIQGYAFKSQKKSIDEFIETGNKRKSYWKLSLYLNVLALVSLIWGFVLVFVTNLMLCEGP